MFSEMRTTLLEAPQGHIMEKLITISTQTYINVISSAALSRRYALMQELAVGLAVHAETGIPTRESKQALYKIYAAAGYDCEDQYGVDYKSTNRRINAGAFLFNKLGASRIEEWIAGHVEMQLIAAIAAELEKLEIKSVNDVLAYVGRPVIAKRPEAFVIETTGDNGEVKQVTLTNIAPTIHEEPLAEQHTKLEEFAGPFHPELAPRPFWIPQWVEEEATQHVNMDNVQININHEVSKDELIAAAMKLLAMANEMENAVPEVPPEPPATAVVKSRRSRKTKDVQ
jgi:hypothetical protein